MTFPALDLDSVLLFSFWYGVDAAQPGESNAELNAPQKEPTMGMWRYNSRSSI